MCPSSPGNKREEFIRCCLEGCGSSIANPLPGSPDVIKRLMWSWIAPGTDSRRPAYLTLTGILLTIQFYYLKLSHCDEQSQSTGY